jgi:hypothetical protein
MKQTDADEGGRERFFKLDEKSIWIPVRRAGEDGDTCRVTSQSRATRHIRLKRMGEWPKLVVYQSLPRFTKIRVCREE